MERTNYDFYNITTKIQEGNLRKQTKNKQLLTITTINNRTQGMKKIVSGLRTNVFQSKCKQNKNLKSSIQVQVATKSPFFLV